MQKQVFFLFHSQRPFYGDQLFENNNFVHLGLQIRVLIFSFGDLPLQINFFSTFSSSVIPFRMTIALNTPLHATIRICSEIFYNKTNWSFQDGSNLLILITEKTMMSQSIRSGCPNISESAVRIHLAVQ